MTKKKTSTRNRSRAKIIAFLVAFRVLLVLVVVGVLYAAKSAIHQAFFNANPQFTLKTVDVEIVKGGFDRDYILGKLAFVGGKDNLFAIDPRQTRIDILNDPLVQEIEVRRLIPDTISLTVFGRTPVAQLVQSGGQLIDAEGIVLNPSSKRETETLPIITGVPDAQSIAPGTKLDNPMVLSALRFLKLKTIVTNGNWLDVKLIQLIENYRELRVYLNENTDHGIRYNAVVVIPVDKMKAAIGKVLDIIQMRKQAGQPTGFINATYEKRVPVRP